MKPRAMPYKIRSNGDGKYWVIDPQTNAPTTATPMTRDDALAERDARTTTPTGATR